MFDNIAYRYDLLNGILSLGLHKYWRKTAISYLNNNPKKILDIATGTADFAISARKFSKAKIIGIDISKNMINIGKNKIKKLNLQNNIHLQIGDSENLKFNDNYFDATTVGFGVRNFENLEKGLKEIYRTLKKNGIVTILEPSNPEKFPLKQIFNIYFNYLLPFFGKIISKNNRAYKYLPESVNNFPKGKVFIKKLEKIGFKKCQHIKLSSGIVDLYVAIK
tara:strand:- start:332 stop:994 length:663 start_codon:yes stop_codon:yes gene_type:complete